MPLAKELGTVVSLPSEGMPGVIQLKRDNAVVLFMADHIGPDFTHEVAGPFEVGVDVQVWAVKLPIHSTYRATEIGSTVEPLTGFELLFAMAAGDESLACRKGLLGSGAREYLDQTMEESWAEYPPIEPGQEVEDIDPWLFLWIPERI